MRKILLATALTAGCLSQLAPHAARAQSIPFTPTISIGPSVSTLGAGLQAGARIGKWIGVRGDFHGFPYSTDRSVSDVDYDADLDLSSFGATADLYLLFGFRLSGGLRWNSTEAELTGTPTRPVSIGNTTYTPAQIGTLRSNVSFDETAPYLGIGYTGGLPFLGLDLVLDAGVLHQGSPRVTLSASGAATTVPGFAADLERERRDLEDDLSDLEWYPVVTVALVYKF